MHAEERLKGQREEAGGGRRGGREWEERENEGEKKENGRKKNEKYIVSWNIGARGAAKCPARYVCTARERRFYFSALLYLQKIIRVASPRPRAAHRLFSVPRCVRAAAAAELNRLVHDRANLRTVVSREKKIRERKNKRDTVH